MCLIKLIYLIVSVNTLNLGEMVRSFLLLATLIFLSSIFSGKTHAQGLPAIFLHTDKGAYFPGDTVWFKGYILNGGLLDESVRNLYIDWGNTQGTILEHNVYLVANGIIPSQFVIPSNYSESVLNLNAYTALIAKNREMGYFKSLPILQQSARKQQPVVANYFLSVYPEGGVYLKGVVNKLILRAYDQSGRGVELKGRLLSKDGRELLNFDSQGEALAEVGLFGTDEEKIIEWSGPDGKISTTKFPEAHKDGAKLSISDGRDTVLVSLLTAVGQQAISKDYTIEARINSRQIFRREFNLASGERSSLKLSKDNLEGGVLQFFLFDEKGQLIGQRALMIAEERLVISPKVEFTEFSKDPKGRNSLQIRLPEGEEGNLSISITDAEVPIDSTHTIVDALLFGSLSKHRINAPFTYFKNRRMLNRFVQINSWQTDFSVYDALKPQNDSLLYLKGRVRMKDKDRALLNKRLVLSKERNLKKGKLVRGASFGYRALSDSLMNYMQVFPDEQGRFALKNFNFLDSMELRFTQIEESVNAIMFNVDYEFVTVPKPDRLNLRSFEHGADETHTFPDKIWDYNPLYFKDQNGVTTLREVKIKQRRNFQLERMDRQLAKGWYARPGIASFDVQNDTNVIDIYSTRDFINYLYKKYPFLNKIRPIYVINGVSFSGRTVPYLRRDMTSVPGLPEEMNQISYVKIFERHPLNPDGGAVVFYTTGPEGANKRLGRRIDLQTIGGYVGGIPFWNRNYTSAEKMNPIQDDDRLTLYWNPTLLLKNKTERLQFNNNSLPRGYWVTIQGVTDSGKLVYYQKLISKVEM